MFVADDLEAWLIGMLADAGRKKLTALPRARIARGGFGVLTFLYPDAALPDVGRIEAGLTAFAAGDALGVPWEGKPAADIDLRWVAEVPQRPGWPRGAFSDDTLQMIVTAKHLIATNGNPDPARFIAELAAASGDAGLRPYHPTSDPALPEDRAGRRGRRSINGAVMRILPAGWAIPASHAERRRDVVQRLTTVTHAAPSAPAAACAVAAIASYALEGCSRSDLVAAAIEELQHARLGVPDVVAAAAEGRWHPGPDGVPLDAIHTLAAVVHVLISGPSETANAMLFAVALGEDTDTVAAITGGILGPMGHGGPIPWRHHVDIPSGLNTPASQLAELRQAFYG